MDVFPNGSSVQLHTPAKLNLFLEVIAKRDDGFHELETLMTAITLYDTLRVSFSPSQAIHVTCRWASPRGAEYVRGTDAGRAPTCDALPEETANLAYRAGDLLRRRARVDRGATIDLVKRIPATAEELSPWVRKSRRVFEQIDCLGHRMSGSGTSYFGICRHARQARRMLHVLKAAGLGRVFQAVTADTSYRLESIAA